MPEASRIAAIERYRHQPRALRFRKQREVAADSSPLRALFCSRRAGKTEEFVFEAVEAMAAYHDAYIIFIGLSIKSARNIFFNKFKRLARRHGWPIQFNEQMASATYPDTGTMCLIFGSDHREDVEKVLGMGRIVLLIIDEAGAWKQELLQETVEDIVGPALEDIEGSRIILGGTPGRVLAGYWHDVTTGKIPGYSMHSWTLDDNPFMPRGIRERVKAKFGWTDESPAYVMNYLGRWCLDPSTLVFSGFSEKNLAVREDKPVPYGHRLRRAISIDFGVVHRTAFGVLETRTDVPGVHVPYSAETTNPDEAAPSLVADRVKSLMDTWKTKEVVGDLGGMGKAYAQEMKQRHKVNIIPADKRDKLALIEMVNDGLRTGMLTLDPNNNRELINQLRTLQWDEEHTDIAEEQRDDSADMLCYGYQRFKPKYIPPREPHDPLAEPISKPKIKKYYEVELT